MEPIIRLKDIIEEIGRANEERRAFLNIRSGSIVTLSTAAADPATGGDAGVALACDDYRELPDQFDIDECSIMRRFCQTVENDELRRGLLRSIQGRGASMRITSAVEAFGIAEEWSAFRNKALKDIAIEWLEKHELDSYPGYAEL